MFGLSFSEIVVVLVVALIVFGPERLPEIARTLGKTVGELRRAFDEFKYEMASPNFDQTPGHDPKSDRSTQSRLHASPIVNLEDPEPPQVCSTPDDGSAREIGMVTPRPVTEIPETPEITPIPDVATDSDPDEKK